MSNLRCKNLGEYRWYEDVFTTRVMQRSDCNSSFWKEKFINGLPRLFGEKVKETLSTPLGVIDYDNIYKYQPHAGVHEILSKSKCHKI